MKIPAARASNAAFSLAELMVVIVIVGLLATLVVPNVVQRLNWAQRETAEIEIRQIEGAVDQYVVMNSGRHPLALAELVAPSDGGLPLLDSTLTDPWETPYAYAEPTPTEPRPWIASYAADKAPGGEGWDEDIENWDLR